MVCCAANCGYCRAARGDHRARQWSASRLARASIRYDAGRGAVSLDVLDAETEGMVGYIIEQELSNALPAGRACATLLTMVEIDPEDAAFGAPDKPIGPVYPET